MSMRGKGEIELEKLLFAKGYKKEILQRNPHLVDYLAKIAMEKKDVPTFTEVLGDELKYADRFNVIYPVGDPIFIHAFSLDSKSSPSAHQRKYHAIEPEVPSKQLIEAVEEAFAIESGNYEPPEDLEEKKALINKILDKILIPVNRERGFYRVRKGKVEVSVKDLEHIRYYMLREKIGVSLLEPLLRDPYIEDISCPGAGCIYIVHKIFGPSETNICFKDSEELNRFIIKLSERIGKPVSRARPIVDAVLPDGSRINIVYGEDVSLRGSNFTIRKFAKEPASVTQLIRWGTMSPEIAAYLWMALREQMNVFICGETASGKTTTLNAIAAFIPPEYKIISIEDTAEVNLPHENWVRELTRDTGSQESSVSMFDLLRAALRQRPNYIIVGEIRGREGNIAFQAMQSVSWHTPVMVRHNGGIEIRAIGDLVDSFFKDGEEGVKRVTGLEVLTITRSLRVGFAEVGSVIRHRYKGKLYRIRLSDGSYVDVTGSHSLMAYNPLVGVYEAKPTELYKGDWLLTASLSTGIDDESLGNAEAPGYICGLALMLCDAEDREERYKSRFRDRLNKGWKGFPEILKRLSRIFDGKTIPDLQPTMTEKPVSKDLKMASIIKCAEGLLPLDILYSRSYAFGLVNAIEDLCGRRCNWITVRGVSLEDIVGWLKRIHGLEDPESMVDGDPSESIVRLGRGVSAVSIASIEEIDYDGYVYDLSVPGEETFLGGSRPILLHNTGHGVMSTFHAANLQRLVQRLTGSPIEVPPSYLDNLNIAVFQSAVYDKRGRLMRRVIEVDEIIGYDPSRGGIAYLPAFIWDPGRDVHIYAGRGSSFILEYKIALRRGIPRSQIKRIYDELALRARFLDLLAKNKVTSYWSVWKAIRATYTQPLEDLVRSLEEGDLSFIEGVKVNVSQAKAQARYT
ncbi:archaeal flagellar protein FlaI [Desulfurococcaceae archaeon AG1]|jgi:type IV secretory pathway ATPase VirB11/archaellum biosynthesis ATPase|nr:archaeal flagellar protein FlaI [Desulfurococcaceae archaeon AG1]